MTVQLNLEKDGLFTWQVTEEGQPQSFRGTYLRQGGELVLTREDGQKMEGTLTASGPNAFRFRLKDTVPNDPGLEFSK